MDWEPLATLREVEAQKKLSRSLDISRLSSRGRRSAVGEHWKIDPESALQLLKQLAEEPQLELWNHEDIGQWASLRGFNDNYAEIVFRIHTVFTFKDGKFTPSQLAGTLIIDRRLEELIYFEMSVPPSTLNFDAHRKRDDELTVTECGVCRIEMTAGEEVTQALAYSEEIPMEEARLGLARQFYPGQFIEWVKLEEAVEMARLFDRPYPCCFGGWYLHG